MTLDWREARIAKNETSFRDINERLEQGLQQVPHRPELLQFVCECGSRECEQLISLTLEEYEAVRRDSRRFAVVPGHFYPDAERVVHHHERYEVVEKTTDNAVEVADAADRRRLGTTGQRSEKPSP